VNFRRPTSVAALVLLLAATARADYDWQDYRNVGPFCPAPAVSTTVTALVSEQSTGALVCMGLGPGLDFHDFGSGPVLRNTSPLSDLSATPPLVLSSNVLSFPGAIYSGGPGSQNLGATVSTAPLGCVTSGGACTVDGITVAGGLAFNTGTGTETLDSFTCGANTFVSSSSTSGLACTQPAFSNLSGSATCAQSDGVFKIYDGGSCGGTAWTTTGSFVAGQPLIATAGSHIATNNICSVIPAVPTACGSTTTTGGQGAYVSGVTTDSVGRTTGVVTTSAPIAGSLVYTLASSSIAMGQNRTVLVMPLPAGAPIINTAAAGTALSTTLSANWGSSSQSPPTFALATLGSLRCTGDITFYNITGGGSIVLAADVWKGTAPMSNPANWSQLATGTLSISGSGNQQGAFTLNASNTGGLIPGNTSVVFVLYRTDNASAATLAALNAQFICELGA